MEGNNGEKQFELFDKKYDKSPEPPDCGKKDEGGESKKMELQIPIHISNVMLWDKEANISSKIGYKLINNEKKRYFKKSY